MNDLNLKDLEKKVYLSYHDDGLLECFIGFTILAFGIGMLLDSVVIFAGTLPAISIPLFTLLKKKLTIPRMGHVVFNPDRKIRMQKEKAFFTVFFLITVLIGLLVFLATIRISTQIRPMLSTFVMAPVGLMGMLTFGVLAYWKQIRRYYFHVLTIGLFVFLGPLAGIPHPIYFSALGAVILLAGLWVLIRFLRKYPMAQMEEFDAQS